MIGDQRMAELTDSLRELNARMPHRAGRGLRPIFWMRIALFCSPVARLHRIADGFEVAIDTEL